MRHSRCWFCNQPKPLCLCRGLHYRGVIWHGDNVYVSVAVGPRWSVFAFYLGYGRRFLCSAAEPTSVTGCLESKEMRTVAKSILSRLLPAAGNGVKATRSKDDTLEAQCPNLYELMTQLEAVPGKPRQVSSLTIFAQDGIWKACLSEKDHELNLWASAPTFFELPEALEARLTADPVPWQAKPGQARKSK